MRRRLNIVIVFLVTLLGGAPAVAENWLSANAAIVSDYRFRGVSLSARRPSLQANADLTAASGWFAGVGGSTIANYGGSHLEVDLYAGRSSAIAGFDYVLTAYGYVYPGGSGVSYGEGQASVSRRFGRVTLGLDAAFSPHQRHTATRNIYAGLNATAPIPATPLTLTVRGGYEDGFYDRKRDWEARLGYDAASVSVSAALVGTDRATRRAQGKAAGTALVFSAAAAF